MRICIITYDYPGKHDFSAYRFVKQLVDALAARGNTCYVLTPFNVSHYHMIIKKKDEYFVGTGKVMVFRPCYLSFSKLKLFGKDVSFFFLNKALKRAWKMMPEEPDVVYGHFWASGLNGYAFASSRNIPLFVATGESVVRIRREDGISDFLNYVRGVICVSSKNKDESLRLGLTSADKCIVVPNAINAKVFQKKDRIECRRLLGWPEEAFIVAFVGNFKERKGPNRLSEALRRIGGSTIYAFFAGINEGQQPDYEHSLYTGSVLHEDLPNYLNAADVFVLPTLQEGCCNAIVEALACGLPVVSSNLPFNKDILDETNSILVDPLNIDEISEAISALRDNPLLRKQLSEGALKRAASLDINSRAEIIENFILKKIKRS